MNNIQTSCPVCKGKLLVRELYCEDCDLSLRGRFSQNPFFNLTGDEQKFVYDFVVSSGSLKVMSEKLGKSYPTVRNVLDALIKKLTAQPEGRKKLGSKKDVILGLVESGRMSVEAAETIIDLLQE
ncbi:MAG: DUF2089 family protein [Pseudomonadota bacterium]